MRIVTIAAAIGDGLHIKVLFFVVGFVTKAIEEGESLAGNRE